MCYWAGLHVEVTHQLIIIGVNLKTAMRLTRRMTDAAATVIIRDVADDGEEDGEMSQLETWTMGSRWCSFLRWKSEWPSSVGCKLRSWTWLSVFLLFLSCWSAY
jgi:hypothetical protein